MNEDEDKQDEMKRWVMMRMRWLVLVVVLAVVLVDLVMDETIMHITTHEDGKDDEDSG